MLSSAYKYRPWSLVFVPQAATNSKQQKNNKTENGSSGREAWRWFVRAVNTRRQRPHVHLKIALRPDLSELAGADRTVLVG
jgi:hypothetical protein